MRPKGLRHYWRMKHGGMGYLAEPRPPRPRKPRPGRSPLAIAAMKARFLLLYASTGVRNKSCEALHWADGAVLAPRWIGIWTDTDPDFARRYTEARIAYGESLESEAHRRAVIGVDKPVFYKGEEVGAIREFSDQLLIALLKANMPDKYRDRIDLSVDVKAEVRRMAEEFGIPIEVAEAEWAALEPRLLGKGS